MKTLHLILIAVIVLAGCKSNKQLRTDIIDLNDTLPQSAHSLNKYMYRQRGDSLQTYDYKFNGNHFKLGADTTGRIQWILVMDSIFATPEGIHIGDKGIKAETIGNPIGKWFNGYFQVRLPSGWIAQIEGGGAFNLNALIHNEHPRDTIVTWIYKYPEK
jgi:hypothetical protein